VATRLIRCIDEKASRIELWTHEDGVPHKVGQYSSVRDMRFVPVSSRRRAGRAGVCPKRLHGGCTGVAHGSAAPVSGPPLPRCSSTSVGPCRATAARRHRPSFRSSSLPK
jgi:hypothetical protein